MKVSSKKTSTSSGSGPLKFGHLRSSWSIVYQFFDRVLARRRRCQHRQNLESRGALFRLGSIPHPQSSHPKKMCSVAKRPCIARGALVFDLEKIVRKRTKTVHQGDAEVCTRRSISVARNGSKEIAGRFPKGRRKILKKSPEEF